jgi:hypothetical protein
VNPSVATTLGYFPALLRSSKKLKTCFSMALVGRASG